MKKSNLTYVLLILSLHAFSQVKNNNGLYIDNEGELFSGIVSETLNDKKTDFTITNGIINGTATYFYTSGKIMETGTFTQGQKDQKWIRYNENGTILGIVFYSLGKKTGTWLVFDDAGKKRFEMNYSEGAKTGVWTNWDENGDIASTKDYSKVN